MAGTVGGVMTSTAITANTGPAASGSAGAEALPVVVLIGDSIRMGYAPLVAETLAGRVRVVNPEPNGGDSRKVLANLDEWAIREHPDVVRARDWNA